MVRFSYHTTYHTTIPYQVLQYTKSLVLYRLVSVLIRYRYSINEIFCRYHSISQVVLYGKHKIGGRIQHVNIGERRQMFA